MKQNLSRNHAMTFRVDAEERDFIYRKMKKAGISNLRHYLLKMAVLGQVVTVDTAGIQECGRLLASISNNVNQIARRVNSGGNMTLFEVDEIKDGLEKVWRQQDTIIKMLTKLIEEGNA